MIKSDVTKISIPSNEDHKIKATLLANFILTLPSSLKIFPT